MKTLLPVFLALVFTGCAMRTGPRTPVVPVPAGWASQEARESALPADEVQLAEWWKQFHDPLLSSLIERAIRSNQSLRIAQSRVLEARASTGSVQAGRLPSITPAIAFTESQRSNNSPAIPKIDPSQVPGLPGNIGELIPRRYGLYQAGFDASFEADLFGGLRKSASAARAEEEAQQEGLRDTLVSVTAEVARNYFQLRQYQEQMKSAIQNEQAQVDTRDITKARFDAGLAISLDVARAEAQLASVQANLPALRSSERQAMYALAVLLGKEAGALVEELSSSGLMAAPAPLVPIGLPSDFLRRRPDIRQAERLVAAEAARVGAAVSDWFPKLRFTGNLGGQSGDISNVLAGASIFWTAMPQVSWGALNYKQTKSNIRIHEAREQQQLATYEQTVLTAIQEVESALAAYSREQERMQKLAAAVLENQKSVDLARSLYVRGLKDFLTMLDAQRSLYSAQDQFIQSEASMRLNLIALYKALGGGWQTTYKALDPH